MKKFLLPLILLVAGCTTPHAHDPSAFAQAEAVTPAALAARAEFLEDRYQNYAQVEGIIWQRSRSDAALENPDLYGSGGDSCIFTGHKLAADVYRYRVTGSEADLDKALQSLRGLYLLTHATGTDGVVQRCAFPATRQTEWRYPERWQHRIDNGFVNQGPATPDPFNPGTTVPPMIYYTRGTKDQVTGLLHGLAVAERYLVAAETAHVTKVDLARNVIAQITEDTYNHLRLHDFKIRDEKGENDTNADSVAHLIKLQLLALYRTTVSRSNPARETRIKKKYDEEFRSAFFGLYQTLSDLFNRFNNFQQYYAWNLRYLRAYTVFILEDDNDRKEDIRSWVRSNLWPFVANHYNTKFTYLHNAITGDNVKLDDALLALKSLSLKSHRGYDSPLAGDERKPSFLQVLFGDVDRFILLPHLRKPTTYTTWQKEPWDVGNPGRDGREDTTGLDFMLAYWMGKFHGFLP